MDGPSDEQEPSQGMTRRQFLARMSLALTGLGATAVGVPVVTVFFGPAFRSGGQSWLDLGALEQFAIGQTTLVTFANEGAPSWSGASSQSAAWLRRETQDEFVAFSIHCTHLGCPVRWEEGAQLFMCPCHGGVFHRDGSTASGPPEQPLAMVPTRVRAGRVEIRPIGIPITSLPE